MASKLLKEIERGESRTLEYKVELPAESAKWVKTIVAFANGAGGKFVLGVTDRRELVGIPKGVDLFDLKDSIANTIGQMCEPQIMFDVHVETVNDVQILVTQVYPGNATPYYIKSLGKENGTFIRLGATTQQADSTILDELYFRGKHVHYDEQASLNANVSEEELNSLCADFTQRAGRQIQVKDLENFHLFSRENGIVCTNALALLLGKHEYTSRIQCARFKGNDRTYFIDKKEFSGPLCEQIDDAYKFVLNHINVGLSINNIVHDERYELPPAAIREMVVNAVVHRNYQIPSSVQVAVYDDRVEVSSPGTLYGTLTLEEALQGHSCLRNKTLARVLEKIGVIESWGSGLRRILTLCEENKIKAPIFEEIGDMFRVTLLRATVTADESATNRRQIGDKSAIIDKIRTYLNDHPNAKSQEIADYIHLKISRTKDYLSQMVQDGTVEPFGGNKNRTYSLRK